MSTQIFNAAIAAYEDSINDLRNMTNMVASIMRNQGKSYEPRITLNQFDILLQYSMLQIALADGYLDESEALFIKDIAQYSDFCVFLNQHGFNNVTWQTIYNTRESTLNSLLDEAKADIMELSEDFITVFSLVDAATDYNFVDDLKRNVLVIVLATCQADGHADAIELNNGCLIVSAINEIERRKKAFESLKN